MGSVGSDYYDIVHVRCEWDYEMIDTILLMYLSHKKCNKNIHNTYVAIRPRTIYYRRKLCKDITNIRRRRTGVYYIIIIKSSRYAKKCIDIIH